MVSIATLVYEVMQTEAPGHITRLVGLDIDQIIANGKTALAISLEGGAMRDHQPVTHELIRAGATSLGSEPALSAICRSGVPELVVAFDARNPGALDHDPDAQRLLHVCRGDLAALAASAHDPATDPYPTLLFAVRAGSVAVVEALLAAGYRADESWGASPARIATRLGHTDLLPLFAADAPDPGILEDAIRENDPARVEAWLSSGTATAAHLTLAFRLGRYELVDAIVSRPAMPTATASQLQKLVRALAGHLDHDWKQRAERNARVLAKLTPHPDHDAMIDAYLDWERDARVAMVALSKVPGASTISGSVSESCLVLGTRFIRLAHDSSLEIERCASHEAALARLPPKRAAAKPVDSSNTDVPKGAYAAELLRLGVEFGPGMSDTELTPLELLTLARWPDGKYAHGEAPVEPMAATPHEARKGRWSIGIYLHYEELAVDGAKNPRVYIGDHETGRLNESGPLLDFLRAMKRVGPLD